MRVLVVEDARPLAEAVAEGLRDQGMAVDVAHDGLDAAARLDVNAYEVVVLDGDLPGIHGDFPELVLRIRALARRRPAARSRTLSAAGTELDPMRRTASRDGHRLDLSVKEFAVLEALLNASPAFLSTEDLLEQVWDEHADPFTNTVTVTVSRLRRKLGDPPVIATIPGVGYRIADAAVPPG
ncbi:response regulator transcription factor [Streptomyces seoulensis]|nr:response regulator transcription factor [Streptomyces seoulensis]